MGDGIKNQGCGASQKSRYHVVVVVSCCIFKQKNIICSLISFIKYLMLDMDILNCLNIIFQSFGIKIFWCSCGPWFVPH